MVVINLFPSYYIRRIAQLWEDFTLLHLALSSICLYLRHYDRIISTCYITTMHASLGDESTSWR